MLIEGVSEIPAVGELGEFPQVEMDSAALRTYRVICTAREVSA